MNKKTFHYWLCSHLPFSLQWNQTRIRVYHITVSVQHHSQRWAPSIFTDGTSSKMKTLGQNLDIQPNAYQLPPMLWKNWPSTGRVKPPQSWELLQNIPSSESQKLSQLHTVTGTSYRPLATILPTYFRNHNLTKLSFLWKNQHFYNFLRFYL